MLLLGNLPYTASHARERRPAGRAATTSTSPIVDRERSVSEVERAMRAHGVTMLNDAEQ
jgi:hypothetical protein